MKACYIFSACKGEPMEEFSPKAGDLIIGADAGLLTLKRLNITPDLAVGDFDSLGRIPENLEVVKHPTKKDDTDTLLAIKIGLERGFKSFVLYGCAGGRLDHTLANLSALSFIAKNGGRGYLYGEDFIATAINEGVLEFPETKRGNISVFSAEAKANISLTGLLYPLENADITFDFPLGVSNEFTGKKATVTVHSGTVTVIWER